MKWKHQEKQMAYHPKSQEQSCAKRSFHSRRNKCRPIQILTNQRILQMVSGKNLLTSTWKRGPIFDLFGRIQEKATGCFLVYSTNVLRFWMLVGCIVWYLNNAGLCYCFLERYLLLRLMSLVFIYIRNSYNLVFSYFCYMSLILRRSTVAPGDVKQSENQATPPV